MDDSMAESDFAMDASSDFEIPKKAPAKKAPVKKAPAAPKAKAAPKKQTTLKTTKTTKTSTKKPPKPLSDGENSDADIHIANNDGDDSLLADTPPKKAAPKKAPAKKAAKPLQEIDNESFTAEGAPDMDGASDDKMVQPKPKKGSATSQYQKLTQLEHIIKRPDTYIGSVERLEKQMWVYNSENEAIESREISYVPGLYKIFDEILVNAADNKQRDKNMNEIKVWIDREKGEISVRNNGRGIPVEMHEKEGIYIPEMIFGHLLTSSNYDDDEQKVTGGRNGYGAKLCNVFSTKFILETVDSKQGKKYTQTWHDNMTRKDKAKITSVKSDDYTRITFYPDFSKFNMDNMDDDFEALAKRRVYDMAGTCPGVKVWLNDTRIKITKFKQYMEMYTKAIKTESLINEGVETQVILTDNPNERWEIGFAVSDGSFQQVSFVNSIATTSGGTHVNYIADQIINKLLEIVKKKNKGGVALKPAQIRNHIFLFVNCLIVNPAFNSQTKEQLTTKASQFGSKCTLGDKFLKDIAKTEAVNNIMHFAQQKADQVLKKSDGNRRTRMSNTKLTDANKAGTREGYKCTLILTEGDSAAMLALAGRAVVNQDLFGVFPLRGKMLNVRDASIDQISKNAEIQNIKQFMGLQHKKEYTDTKGLRYGHLMIMTDQDHDGSHIKGLLINFLQVQFPSLLKIEGFLLEFITPIVKVWKGDPKFPKVKRDFFTMPEYEAWRQQAGHDKGWEHKYYKGLGTSDTRDAEIYFSDLDKHLKTFHTMQDHEKELIDLAFSKKKADDRKMWLQNFVPGTYLDMSGKENISYDDFINKELILFSMADNFRSIPSLVDGFKPGQRKILYTALRRNLKKDIKVVELAGLVSGLTAYSYGETSLQQTIVGLAQTFVGSNNINVLEPSGNFGSRLQGGSDAASARYIYTRLSPFARRLFNAHDEPLLTYNTDDGKTIEPETYIPVVPMILINGADGIGTGWSTSIPNYNPQDVIENIRLRMAGSSKADMKPMQPWFRGWTGEVEDIGNGRFRFTGTVTHNPQDNTVEVTELPVRFWTQDFKAHLEEIIKAEKTPSFIKDYSEYNTPEKVHFIITLDDKGMKVALDKGLEEQFKLSRTMATTNLVAFDGQGRIHKYETPLDIMEEFYHIRLAFYEKRKQYLLNEMQRELDKLSNQSRFVQMIIDGKLVVSKKKKSVLVAELHKLNFKPIPKLADAKKQGELEDVVEEEDDSDDAAPGANDFDYLLGMAIWSLTQERVEKLLKQIGDKEAEVDALIKLSPKDLWTRDLDELLEEWHTQLEVEETRAKKSKSKGRRTSYKLGGAASKSKKRKSEDSDDDDDYDFKKPKTAAKTSAASRIAPAPRSKVSKGAAGLGSLDNFLQPTVSKPAGVFPVVDGIEQQPVEAPPAVKAGLIAPSDITKPLVKRKVKLSDTESDDDIEMIKKPVAKAPIRKKTALDTDDEEDVKPAVKVTAKPVAKPAPKRKPVIESDSGESDVDMFDAEKMKPVAQCATTSRNGRAATKKPIKYALDSDEEMSDDDLGDISKMVKEIPSAAPGRSLLSNSAHRPGASHGIKPSQTRKESVEPVDDTDWAELAKGTPAKPIAQVTNFDDEDASMDDDSILLSHRKPAPLKTISKTTATKSTASTAAKAKKPAVAPVKTLSPAAKAYAAKQSKLAAPKPAPKAPIRKKTALDSEDEDEDLANDILSDEDEDSVLPSPGVKPAGARPSRRAAAVVAKKKYVLDDDEESEEEVSEEEEEEETFEDESD
ncbi:type II DNA topoisomerase [Aureobasidium subglaciale]|nr:type II DNA topoisomerase [Aureobasidium subglaciale]